MQTKKNILVTATGGRSVGAGILHSLTRTSADVRNRWNVVAADADSFSWGLYKTDEAELLPFASAPSYLDEVERIVKKRNIHAIIPGSEPEVDVLSANADRFAVPVICNSRKLMPLMMDKFAAAVKIKELGLSTIDTYKLADKDLALAKYDFPFIVKPTRGTGGSKGVYICTNESEVNTLLKTLPEDGAFCIQPIIGTDEDEYTVGILTDKDGALIDSIVIKRKLTGLSLLDSKKVNGTKYAISTGYSQGYVIKDERIQSFCEKLALNLGSIGPLNIQLRVDKDNIYVFEIHSRFSGTTPMRADVGFNEPDVLLRNFLFDEKFGRLPYQYNVAAIRAFEHVIVPIDKMIKN